MLSSYLRLDLSSLGQSDFYYAKWTYDIFMKAYSQNSSCLSCKVNDSLVKHQLNTHILDLHSQIQSSHTQKYSKF